MAQGGSQALAYCSLQNHKKKHFNLTSHETVHLIFISDSLAKLYTYSGKDQRKFSRSLSVSLNYPFSQEKEKYNCQNR